MKKTKIHNEEDFQKWAINDIYIPYLECRDRFLFLGGGTGSGKSVFAAQKVLFRMMNERGHRILCVRKVGKTIYTSQFQELKDEIARLGMSSQFKIDDTRMKITYIPNGSCTISAGLDDVLKLSSISGITSIWIEELFELSENDFNLLMLRLRGIRKWYKQIIATFNPIDEESWIATRFFPGEHRDKREGRYAVSAARGQKLMMSYLFTTILDNDFRDEEDFALIEMLKDSDYQLYEVMGKGRWGTAAEGLVFKRQYYREWDSIPADAYGVIYCDPNLSKKGKGDRTAIFKTLYSPSNDFYYFSEILCESYSGSNELLDDVLKVRDKKCKQLAFDGNVSQESSWTQHVENWCQIKEQPYPVVEYKHYSVDMLTKNTQILWNSGKLHFPPHFKSTDVGKVVTKQIYTFKTKKDKRPDDAPDAMMCSIEFLIDSGYAKRSKLSEFVSNALAKFGGALCR